MASVLGHWGSSASGTVGLVCRCQACPAGLTQISSAGVETQILSYTVQEVLPRATLLGRFILNHVRERRQAGEGGAGRNGFSW